MVVIDVATCRATHNYNGVWRIHYKKDHANYALTLIISVKNAYITKLLMKSFYANSNLTLKLRIIMSLYCCL